ncbi:uroporphyrinogen-III synthase [Jeotgalibacillus haloalkalitolerans]|uniref:Uroporphyrinogen-III synthase n=1 Tax=Jeotgalibacillus haloalkalitolerans TaxID=3104292 RepID=A0ABU5KMR9_9BACL|nr:uroporphyrinogen-III synthase [Jeotgalibacillus sp. HH7-29]MDZ5712378.1 uroporphyrinogen-III synthase [Jeotgalibacillus sp. HH7-29]
MASLNGAKVVLTRDLHSSENDRKLIEAMGGKPIITPMIQIEAEVMVIDEQKKDQLKNADWIIFTSKHGVYYFCRLLEAAGIKELIFGKKISAVGSKTAEALKNEGLPVHYIPPLYSAASFKKNFTESVEGPVLFPQGDLSRGEIAKFLAAKGHKCISWTVYKNTVPDMSADLLNELKEADVITFFSPSAAERFIKAVGSDQKLLSNIREGLIKIASVGPTTSDALKAIPLPVHIEPSEYTMEAMIEKIAVTLK